MSNDYDKEFVTRLQEAIEDDATIKVYVPEVIAVTDGDLDDNNMNAFLGKCMFVVHSPNHGREVDAGGNGRIDIVMEAVITAVSRSAKGIDVDNREVGLYGDGTATHPGPIEMQSDIEALLMNSGAMHFLPDSVGASYLWDLEIGPTSEPEKDIDDTGETTYISRSVVGHKWEYTWT